MLRNTRVMAFTVFELLRENQLGGGNITPPNQISVKYWVLVIIFLGKIFWKYLCHKNKHFLKQLFFYSYFKIDLSQIIACIIKIQSIKIFHDYDNNLAQKETFTKYAKIETFFRVTPLNGCFRWGIKS